MEKQSCNLGVSKGKSQQVAPQIYSPFFPFDLAWLGGEFLQNWSNPEQEKPGAETFGVSPSPDPSSHPWGLIKQGKSHGIQRFWQWTHRDVFQSKCWAINNGSGARLEWMDLSPPELRTQSRLGFQWLPSNPRFFFRNNLIFEAFFFPGKLLKLGVYSQKFHIILFPPQNSNT